VQSIDRPTGQLSRYARRRERVLLPIGQHSPGASERVDRQLQMEQITLRQWRDSDVAPYAAMNADPEVMRYFPSLLSREQSNASLARQRSLIEQRGWGLWALDVDGVFAGFTGLAIPGFEARFMPCVEADWRLRREYWGRGVAYRGALQALEYGFNILKLPEIVSFTAAVNAPSRRLMERLGFIHDTASDFDHPSIPEGHELRNHALYRKKV
jgi:RimJ/RimL family protein N-acetyltransferase